MSIKTIIIGYLLTFVVFLFVDMLWLGILAKKIYHKYLGHFFSESVNWTAAFIFYFIYVVGISVFVIYPALNKGSLMHATIMGALFGLFTYATYDLTNLATLKGWPLPIVFIDICWGIVLSTIVSICGFLIIKWVS